ncbi:MAG: hypothetical protein HY513_04670 [Candidatus Aenigmarchaeota archaeon]|nr:hypothetical protein [Candidatus Aenigmarchaeota archaeon]
MTETKPIPIRLPKRDVELIDEIVTKKKALFTNRSDFARFAIEKTIFDTFRVEAASKFLNEMGEKGSVSKDYEEKINSDLHKIRKKMKVR